MKLIEKNCYVVVFYFGLVLSWFILFIYVNFIFFLLYVFERVGFYYCCSIVEIVVICYIWLKVICIGYEFVVNFFVWFF